MKLINSFFGLAAVHVNADAVMPLNGVVIRDVIEAVVRRYEFVNRPPAQMVVQGQPVAFQSGVFKTREQRIPVIQAALLPNGDIIMAQTTEAADLVLSDIITMFEEAFSYRYKSAGQKRLYHSNVVVEFEKDVGSLDLFAKIQNLLNAGKEQKLPRFQIKRISFGEGEAKPQPTLSIEAMESADFAIERRAGEPYSSNRFFCAAPMHTDEHVALLEKIEKLF